MILPGGVPTPAPRYRVRIFVDYWNFTLSLKQAVGRRANLDWKLVGPRLSDAAAAVVGSKEAVTYQGMNVYTSFDPRSTKDENHRNWAEDTLTMFPGVSVSVMKRRKKRNAPKCPKCYKTTDHCWNCGGDMRGTEEKGVDTRIVTDMISLAWVNNYDIAVLVSSDTDFVPVVKFLGTQGFKIIHGKLPRQGNHLTKECWGHFDILGIVDELRRD